MGTRNDDTDFFTWTQAQVDTMRAKDWGALDKVGVVRHRVSSAFELKSDVLWYVKGDEPLA